jgi:Rieske 2Fe-2S family protein
MGEGLQAALPREMYVDPASWAVEREAVLYREWYCLGRLDDLGLDATGRVMSVDVVGESVLVTSDDAGRLHASYNVCRHRGSQLRPPSQEACEASALRCPYHSWTYGLDGRLLRSPHADVGDPAEFALDPVGVDTWGGFVFVNLTPQHAQPLDEQVGRAAATLANYGLADLVTGATLAYEVAANYKVLLENYNECYHCGPVHPELSRLVPAFAGGGSDLDWDHGIPHREGAWTFTVSGTTTRACLPGLDEHERTRHKGDLVYPNLMLSASADHVAAFVLEPRGVDRTSVTCSLLFAREEAARSDFDPSDAVELWDLVNRQDWAVCESVQRGMSSRSYRHGWFAPMEDESLDIRRWLLPRLHSPDVVSTSSTTVGRSTGGQVESGPREEPT